MAVRGVYRVRVGDTIRHGKKKAAKVSLKRLFFLLHLVGGTRIELVTPAV